METSPSAHTAVLTSELVSQKKPSSLITCAQTSDCSSPTLSPTYLCPENRPRYGKHTWGFESPSYLATLRKKSPFANLSVIVTLHSRQIRQTCLGNCQQWLSVGLTASLSQSLKVDIERNASVSSMTQSPGYGELNIQFSKYTFLKCLNT